MSTPLYSDKVKKIRRLAKVVDCDEWLYEIHQRYVILEQEKVRLNTNLLEKGKKIEELKAHIEEVINTEATGQEQQTRSWSSLFDKDTKKKDTESEIILMAKIREETMKREKKEKNLVINGLEEGTKTERENEEEDWTKVCDLIREIGNDQPEEIITKIYRRGNKERGRRAEVVELKKKEDKNGILRDAKNLKNNITYGNVYINKDLTKNEIEEEKMLKKLREKKMMNWKKQTGGTDTAQPQKVANSTGENETARFVESIDRTVLLGC